MSHSSIFLNARELIELTSRSRPKAQIRALQFMGIEYRVRPDGSVVVIRAHVEHSVSHDDKNHRMVREPQPNWGAI